MLKERILKEELEIVDGKAFAVFSCKEERRVIDGCQRRQELIKQTEAKQKELEDAREEVKRIEKELTELLKQEADLTGAYYCDLTTPVYKVIDGVVQKDENGNDIIEGYTHSEYCTHKEANNG